ncbi:MAG TPA: flagellar motor switch protein FliN [Persephonella sp.]|uniref:Flagellar motor switch protein FliN n=1 Tax=Persephonella marina (strain DSM 14350 / EX-H1) TaxID=123214 RepID=C0QPC5_PERMH|nr:MULTISPECIES: flagellar motor switch protein FliN [Persephonella]ACO04271.1 flagellar motor switch protein FliN [Persephonella marina EX-H1]HCB69864.1 flagellar motor switch protein FliN [Persephonella sp.]
MSEEEKKEQEEKEEEIDQEALAEEWAKMAESEKKEEEEEEVDQEKLAEEWAKMAEESEEEKEEEVDQEALAKEWEQMAEKKEEKPEEKPVERFEKPAGLEQEKLDLLMDIPLEVSVEIGSTHLPLEEILKLNPNNIVELDKFINQPVDLKVNGKLIAKGELYTVEDHFGIKITSIITVQERMKLLTEEQE